MQKLFQFILIASLFLVGCSSHTTVGGGLNRTSPDGKFELSIECNGANGHAYIDKTKKTIWIWINDISSPNRKELFKNSYTFVGSDIQWQTSWTSNQLVSLEVYDWGDGVSNYNNMNHMTASNHIALLSFVLDKATGKFIEQK
ncbi:MAG TPA: hypothetical protein VIK53_00435 [Verrucomicrobiae bacterium]